ncbi:hypothetical protein RYH80_07110 [Halobaculum sp. MBLA0147]|uniref:hypothetical protein n=1 Tax=Halobaculum sp. MBLA0147 TaxID=3079934 RepID=UPI0035240611
MTLLDRPAIQRDLLAVVCACQRVSQRPSGVDVIERLGECRGGAVSDSTVYEHLGRLETAGYLEDYPRGNVTRYQLSPLGRQAIQAHLQELSLLCR